MERDAILTFDEMCQAENTRMLQRGMTFRPPPAHGIILMSLRTNAPYADEVDVTGTLIYEGHDATRAPGTDPKRVDQPRRNELGRPTENGKFAEWTDRYKQGLVPAARFHVYEKMQKGIWSFRGGYLLRDYRLAEVEGRKVFKFELEPAGWDEPKPVSAPSNNDARSRAIPTWVKQAVYKRDHGRCVLCGSSKDLHFDHELPYSRGGTSLAPENIRVLCAKHNLSKGARIE